MRIFTLAVGTSLAVPIVKSRCHALLEFHNGFANLDRNRFLIKLTWRSSSDVTRKKTEIHIEEFECTFKKCFFFFKLLPVTSETNLSKLVFYQALHTFLEKNLYVSTELTAESPCSTKHLPFAHLSYEYNDFFLVSLFTPHCHSLLSMQINFNLDLISFLSCLFEFSKLEKDEK